MVYIFNTPVVTEYGDWGFAGPITVEEARDLISGGFVSVVGHEGAAVWLSRLLGVEVPINRIRAQLLPGDKALVVRFPQRLSEARILTAGEMENLPFELGVLTRKS